MKSDPYSRQAQITDVQLVKAFRKDRNLEILGTLYKRYMHMVYGVCMKYLKNREDSQDTVMQVFEILIRDIPRFEIQNFKSWLYTVTKNQCLMKLRTLKKIRNSQSVNLSVEFMESTAVMHPIDEVENDLVMKRLERCLEQLNNWQRTCIEKFYYEKKCYREIAVELKLNENKVKSYIQNGKRNLKICMEQKEILKDV